MSLLLFRTETTAIPRRNKSPSDATQPRVMRLSALQLDRKRREVAFMSALIRPEGWVSTAEASKAHGIEQRICENYGVRVQGALAVFIDMLKGAEELAAYDYPFHSFMIDIELAVLKSKVDTWKRSALKRLCVKATASAIANSGKPMKLEAAHLAMVEVEHHQRNDPLEDLRAIARIHYATIDRRI